MASFVVSVEANPPPTIKWQFNSEDMAAQEDDRIDMFNNGSLAIRDTVLADSGVYTILADNGVGSVARFQITLKVLPEKMPIEVSRSSNNNNNSYSLLFSINTFTACTHWLTCMIMIFSPAKYYDPFCAQHLYSILPKD